MPLRTSMKRDMCNMRAIFVLLDDLRINVE